MAERFELVVRNGTLVSGDGRRPADIAVRDGRFAAFAPPGQLQGQAQRELDATGHFVLPGLVDGHVHFRQPGLEHKEDWLTGSRAAVMGGVTTVLEMPNTLPPTAGLAEAQAKIALAEAGSYCDFGLFGLLGRQPTAELRRLTESGLLVGLKVFLGPTTGGLEAPTDEQLLAGLALAREAGLRVAFHAEEAGLVGHDSRPIAAEVAAIEHACRLLGETGAKGHILHLSSEEGLAAVSDWRGRGLDLTCEVSAHHCFLSAGDIERLGGVMKCYPPIREAGHGQALLNALAWGRIDCIASDHAPHAPDEKMATDQSLVPAGIAGVETTLTLMLTHGVNAGRLTLERLVSAFAERPAHAWGLWPRKGSLEPGADADLVLVDLDRQGFIRGAELNGKHGLTPFEGWPVRGAPLATIVRGRLVMEQGELVGEPGWGRLTRPA